MHTAPEVETQVENLQQTCDWSYDHLTTDLKISGKSGSSSTNTANRRDDTHICVCLQTRKLTCWQNHVTNITTYIDFLTILYSVNLLVKLVRLSLVFIKGNLTRLEEQKNSIVVTNCTQTEWHYLRTCNCAYTKLCSLNKPTKSYSYILSD